MLTENNSDESQPLLAPANEHGRTTLRPAETAVFTADSDDIPPITGVGDFFREYWAESMKLWYLAGPAIFTSLSQYSLGAITQSFLGQVSTIDLAAFAVENSVIAGFCFGVMVTYLPFTLFLFSSILTRATSTSFYIFF